MSQITFEVTIDVGPEPGREDDPTASDVEQALVIGLVDLGLTVADVDARGAQ